MTQRDTVTLRRWLWPVSVDVAEWLAHALHDQHVPDAERDGLTDDERMAASFIADHNDDYVGLSDLLPLRGLSGPQRFPLWDNPSGSGSWVVDALLPTSSRQSGPFSVSDPFEFIFDPDVEAARRYVTTEELYDNAAVTVVDGPEFCDPIWTVALGDPTTDIVAAHNYRTTHGVYLLERKDEP